MKKYSNKADCFSIAEAALHRHLVSHALNHYGGLLSLFGLVRMAEMKRSGRLRRQAVELLRPFYSGAVTSVGGVFSKMYCSGGIASAALVRAGYAPEVLPVLVKHADELIASHPRNSRGIFGRIEAPEKIWIDAAFAVSPFLVYTGNLTGEKKYLDEACRQMRGLDEVLRNRTTGLYHQSMNFAGPGKLSGDHWSRGNGWAAFALAELIAELPPHHDEYEVIKKMYLDLMEAVIRYQDSDGMWHQEMTEKTSYVETSGGGLILYAIGRGIEKGIVSKNFIDVFRKGIRGYSGYIALDGSICNTCIACLCPGDGSKAAYMAQPHLRNDEHAFGPAVLCFGQAHKIGMKTIDLT